MSTSTTSEASKPSAGLNPWKPRIIHTAYHVHDIDRALSFYVGVLGMQETMRVKLGPTAHEAVLSFPDNKGSGVILMWDTARATPPAPGEGYSRIVLHVHDLDAALKHVRDRGGVVSAEPQKNGNLHWAMIKDPDGYVIELLHISRG